ncbi:hypothetical protein DBR47_02955 [Paucibacter sp. KBW04]|uniref:EAL domain-containing protein n=1 Tax=Paucibacter sp. KBW04 TaxID=2153361 RepID=UPI000F56E11A|nr:EAL domain-containing protein [Paucibacter sp. KBW04]RQO63504.1 hypothetical protein DBR47_02955 [Paucibacter sp. KBW04]
MNLVPGARSRNLRMVAMLLGIFAVACVLGYAVVRDAVTKIIETEAQAVAEIIAMQAGASRAVYAKEVFAKLNPSAASLKDASGQPVHLPIPAEFLKLVGRAAPLFGDKLYEYKPVSKWNLEESQGLSDEFLRWAWPQLEAQDQVAPQQPIQWKPVSRLETQDGRRVFRYLAADPVSQQLCASCHNALEQTPLIQARRLAAGVPAGKHFAQHQLMGALSITIPLDKAEQIARAEIDDTARFFFGLVLVCFIALAWFAWQLASHQRHLRDAVRQLAQAELDSRGAALALEAKQGVEQAFAELSTFIQAIDLHAIVSVSDRQGRITHVNQKFIEISGYSREELMGQDHRILNSGQHPHSFFDQMWATIANGEIWRDVICNRAKSGRLYWVDSAIVPQRDAAGQIVRFVSIRIDITEQRRHEDALHYQATHDGLTDLPNRVLLLDRISHAIARAKRGGGLIVLFFIDLNKFKYINDSLGHSAGDEVLREMARRLSLLAREGDTVARLGGDEFVVACEGLAREDVDQIGARICDALSAPVNLQGESHTLGGSVGVAMFPDDGEDTETLLKRADIAMYEAKSRGGSVLTHFSPEMQAAIDRRLQMEIRLREGIPKGELVLEFQPQVDFKSGTLVSFEALVRWNSPEYGRLGPGQFLPLAEESNLIELVDSFVLDEACRQMAAWARAGHGWIRVAVNLAATKFSDPEFLLELRRAMQKHGVPQGVLELEVTESLAMRDPKASLELMQQLRGMGVLLAIDDFGTGYSNLGYLRSFPAERLKVDQGFVRGLTKNPQDRAIVAAVIQLAHNLHMRAIAEGVETEEEAIILFSLNVDEVQGYLVGRPQPPEQVERLFKQPTLLDPRLFMHADEVPVVLLVEDHEVSLELMEHLLGTYGVKVVCARSAEQARELFHQHHFALAIVDHGLPGESGIQLLASLKQLMPQTVRVLVTASVDPQVMRDAINLGGAGHFLAKPIDADALRAIVMKSCWNHLQQRPVL